MFYFVIIQFYSNILILLEMNITHILKIRNLANNQSLDFIELQGMLYNFFVQIYILSEKHLILDRILILR
jgi:hypothetical protein